jgi:hypothetical protein
METKKSQSLVIPIVVVAVCLVAFGIPYLFFMGVDDSRDDIVLVPPFTATPTPLDRILTRQAFANLFFTPTKSPVIIADTAVPTSTEAFVGILITGATATNSPTPSLSPTLTATRTLVSFFPTRTQSGGGNPLPSSTSTNPSPPTATAIIIEPITSTPTAPEPPTETPVPEPTDTPEPPPAETDTPKPVNTNKPPTKTPEPPATDTPEPPPTSTLDPGGNGTKPGDLGLFGLILLFLSPFAIVIPRKLI